MQPPMAEEVGGHLLRPRLNRRRSWTPLISQGPVSEAGSPPPTAAKAPAIPSRFRNFLRMSGSPAPTSPSPSAHPGSATRTPTGAAAPVEGLPTTLRSIYGTPQAQGTTPKGCNPPMVTPGKSPSAAAATAVASVAIPEPSPPVPGPPQLARMLTPPSVRAAGSPALATPSTPVTIPSAAAAPAEIAGLQQLLRDLQIREQNLSETLRSSHADHGAAMAEAQEEIMRLLCKLTDSAQASADFHSLADTAATEVSRLKPLEEQLAHVRLQGADVAAAVRVLSIAVYPERGYSMIKDDMDTNPDAGNTARTVLACSEEVQRLHARFTAESQRCRELNNSMLDLKGAIRVFCRVRPLSLAEEASGLRPALECSLDSNAVTLTGGRLGGFDKKGLPSEKQKVSEFDFDGVYGPTATQLQVFEDTQPVVISVLDGYNVCIFAYGQTGSGKTHTMEGPAHDRGVNYRTLANLFAVIEERQFESVYTITISALEVYMEQIWDLLSSEDKKLDVKSGPAGNFIPGLVTRQVSSVEEAWEAIDEGTVLRRAAETLKNERSSRSHSLVNIRVRGQSKLTGDVWRSSLWLVDLAGSERVSKTEASGLRLKEAQFINRSLAAVGDCIHALAVKAPHVPFRNSKLTHLLQDALSGDSKMLMMVNASPATEDAPETACSLAFAARVRGVKLGHAKKHVESGLEVRSLRGEISALEDQVARLQSDGEDSSRLLSARDSSIAALNVEVAEQKAVALRQKEHLLEVESNQRGSSEAAVLPVPQTPLQSHHMTAPLTDPGLAYISSAVPPASCTAQGASTAAPLSAIKARRAPTLEPATGFTTQRRSSTLAKSPFSLAHFASVLRDPPAPAAAAIPVRSPSSGGLAERPGAAAATIGQGRPPAGKQLPRRFRDSLGSSAGGGGGGGGLFPKMAFPGSAAVPSQMRRVQGVTPKALITEEVELGGQLGRDDSSEISSVAKSAAQSDTPQHVVMPVTGVLADAAVAEMAHSSHVKQKPPPGERLPFDASSTLKALSSALLRRASLPLRIPRSLRRQSGAPPSTEQVVPPPVFESRSVAEVPHQTIMRAPLQPQSNVVQLSSVPSSNSMSKVGATATQGVHSYGIAVAPATEAGSENIKDFNTGAHKAAWRGSDSQLAGAEQASARPRRASLTVAPSRVKTRAPRAPVLARQPEHVSSGWK